jgi:hypothetical protein
MSSKTMSNLDATPMTMDDRLFTGIYPGGIVFADRATTQGGDYKRLAFLPYNTLQLDIRSDCPAEFQPLIIASAKEIQAKAGEQIFISSSGQTIRLGSKQ